MTTANRPLPKRSSLGTILLIALGTIILTLTLTALSFGGAAEPESVRSMENLPLPLILHIATVVPALPLGAWVLFRRKGDALHRLLGRIWAALMLTTAVVSLWVGESFSFIHIFSAIVIVSIPYAVWQARRGNIEAHYKAMEGVYIGIIIAGAFTFIPGRLFGTMLFG
ncbi:DUF2306 domain-containing protein [Parasphingopyxis sp.]|uniref:DUF2306 domain-containing protein n=1 Tax=Parasphingopyxis sp. TaxID=1920299 RepID=UPI00262AAF73|nr:DUF2306 domain-containing protein [Parasphingopyxis sp.]